MQLVDQEKCLRCGACVAICPLRIYEKPEGDEVRARPERAWLCVRCGHCMGVCPTGAVAVDGLGYSQFMPLPEKPPTAEDFARLVLTRRSIRHYRPDPVPRELLETVLEMAAQAPAGVPPTTVEVAVITDRNRIAELGPAVIHQIKQLRKALRWPVVGWLLRRQLGPALVAAMDRFIGPLTEMAERLQREEGLDMVTWGAPVVMVFHSAPAGFCAQENCIIAATYAMLAAHSLGLGTCWNGFVGALLAHDRTMRERMGIPGDHSVHAALLTGYPAWPAYRRVPPRSFRAVRWT
ncbi:MAG: nitroreductase family protein [Armatimonadetes bacterium]|nr:nitroreductase family protein [Armatimonadota bacterium]